MEAKLSKHWCRSSGKSPGHVSMLCSLQELDTAQSTLPPRGHSSAPSKPPCTRAPGCSCRLQNLEATQSHLHGELDTIKGLGNTIEAWRQEMDAASAQAATVLTLVTADTGQVR